MCSSSTTWTYDQRMRVTQEQGGHWLGDVPYAVGLQLGGPCDNDDLPGRERRADWRGGNLYLPLPDAGEQRDRQQHVRTRHPIRRGWADRAAHTLPGE